MSLFTQSPRRSVRLLVSFGILFVLAIAGYAAYLSLTVALPSLQSEEHQPLRIYAAPFRIITGFDLDQSALERRLHRLGYRQTDSEPNAPGQYHLTSDHLDLYLEGQTDSIGPHAVRLTVVDGQVRRIVSVPDEAELSEVRLEPPLISGIGQTRGSGHARIRREWLSLAEIPRQLVDAVLSTEDHRFYHHVGVDPIAVGRALWENLGKGQIVQGGSTITQQLAKNLYFSSERTLLRKVREAVAAFVLEQKYSKEAILEAYLNEIYFGQVGSVGVYGVSEAARVYFDKPVQALSLPEAALLAGMIKAPNLYSPLKDLRQAKRRRDVVLHRLHDNELLSPTDLAQAVRSPVQVATVQARPSDAPYFVDYVLREYESEAGEGAPSGARLYTTLDAEMQRTAEEAVTSGLAKLETRYRHLRRPGNRLQAALVVLDPKTGAVLAMVGGRDYRESQFNRAVQARRQAGSLFKPFIYLAAFEQSLFDKHGAITAATLIEDSPLTFPNGQAGRDGPSVWSPQNYDRQFHGEVTVRSALERSLNIPAIRIAQQVGVGRIARTLRDVGITDPLQEDLSLALGSAEVSLLEMTSAFGALANGGLAVRPTATLEQGSFEVPSSLQTHRVASAQAAYLVTSLLEGVVARGTAAQARSWGLEARVAGKTGTTDDHRDAWFIGYTPNLVIGMWVGHDDGESLRLSGSQAALPIWVEFARKVLAPAGTIDSLALPAGIVARKIDPRTALLATSNCPEVVEEIFIEGTEPSDYCHLHASFWDRLKHTFGL
jgi:penicillin-binding protein 1B